MQEFLNMFSYGFVQKALIAGILISVCAALMGVILVLKRYSLIGHGLGDVSFAATSLAVAMSWPVMPVAIPIVIIAACLIMYYSQKVRSGGDVAIGMVATIALSAGIIITAVSSGFNVDTSNYMFGSVLAMSTTDVIFSVILSIIIAGLYLLFFNRLFLITCDETYAKASGIHVGFYQFLIALLTALVVVVGMRMMGSLLISSLIIFPAVTARKLANSFKYVVIVSVVLSILGFIGGICLSFVVNLPTGASIVMVHALLLAVVSFLKILRRN